MNKKFIFLIVLLLICSMLIAQKIHVVKKGDTLWDLAGYYYDNPFIWRNIYNANLDKIDDPHWIYPGQEFIIPDVPDDMAEYIPEEEPVDYDTERTPAELIVEKEDDEKEFTYKKMFEDEEVSEIKKIREDIKKIEESKSLRISNAIEYAVAKKFAFRAGYITPDDPAIGHLDKLYKGSMIYSNNEKAYIRLNNDNYGNIIGKKLIIYKWNNSVRTEDGDNLGKHVNILGIIEIDGFEDNIAYGTIKATYGFIRKNDKVAFYNVPMIPINNSYLRETHDIRAYFVGKADKKTTTNDFSIVFIDIGKEKMINHGDVFTIIRKNETGNYFAAGALQVLVPYDNYSTAAILSIKGNTDLSPMEEIRLSYRNKSAYLINQYKKISDITGDVTVTETEEEIIMEEIVEEPVIEEIIIVEEEIIIEEDIPVFTEETEEEIIIEEDTYEPEVFTEETETIIEEDIVEEDEIIVYEEDEIIIYEESEEIILEEDEEEFVVEEEAVSETDEGFIIEEQPSDNILTDSIIVEDEDEIIIVEDEDEIIIIE